MAAKKKRAQKKSARKKPAKKQATRNTPRTGAAWPSASSASGFAGYSPDALRFLVELAGNNERDWFKANQDRYESSVRSPTLDFVRAMRPRLEKISQHLLAIDKKVGGSMMRPQRDTRFSADSSPYKTNVGVHFRHSAGKDVHAPGAYFHFDAEDVFVGVGMWHPEAEALAAVRRRIDAEQRRYRRIVSNPKFTAYFKLGGDRLKRPPKGYDASHPLVDALKLKDHIAMSSLDASLLTSPRLIDEVAARFSAAAPYMKFLTDALGLAF